MARYLGARLVPNHVLCGPGFCVAEFGDPVFFEVARKVRAVVYERIAEAPPDAGFVLRSVLIDGAETRPGSTPSKTSPPAANARSSPSRWTVPSRRTYSA